MLHSSYSPFLIIFSVFIAIISSFTTLVIVERIFDGNRSRKLIWLFLGAFILGSGIFSMHFVSMIAFHVDYQITFDTSLLLVSFISSLLSSFAAFYILYVQPLTKTKAIISGLTMGIGIVLLHYIATVAIKEPVEIQFKSIYFTLSIIISLVFSTLAIKLFMKMKEDSHVSIIRNVFSAIVLGITFFLMHFTGMKATNFLDHHYNDGVTTGIDSFILGNIIACGTLMTMIITLFSAFLDYRSLHMKRHLLKKIMESEERYRSLVELSPEPIIVHDGKVIMFVNEACLRLVYASNKNELIGKSIMEFLPTVFRKNIMERLEKLRDVGRIHSLEQEIISLDGSVIDVEIAGIGIIYENKPAFQWVVRDITEQKKIRKELEEKQQRYQSLFEHNPDPVFSMDQQGNFQEVNTPVRDILGYSKEELLRMSFHKVIDPNFAKMTMENFQKALDGNPQNYEIIAISKNGNRIPALIKNVPIIVDGKVVGVYGIAKDMTKEKKALQKIKELAYTDQLTGLPNRTWFYKYLAEVIKKTNELKQSIAILMVDFDNFKNVNDTFGHHTGDLFLRKISERLRNCLRKHDKIARLGGDEFIIILKDVSKHEAARLAQRILKEMNQIIYLFGHEIIVTLSIGISIYSECTTDVETIIKEADLAMYLAKEKGKNNCQFFTKELNERVTRKLKLESSLRKALQQQELKIFYQPLMDIQTGKLAGLEALLRWNPSFGFVSPGEFIPIAEETGIIVPIGEWVIKEACRQIKYWENHGLLKVPISVNVSARQFKDANFTRKVKDIILEEKINPRFFEIEITESVMLNVEESFYFIQELRDLGIRVAIDDFGAGYSSLHMIANLEFDTLKIDKSLIDDGINNERKWAIIKAIIEATNDQKRIVVEGIETEEQVDVLKRFCIIGQGFYFSHPLPPEQLEQKVKQIEGK